MGPRLVAGYDDDSDAGGWGDLDFGVAGDAEGPGLAAPRKVQQIAVNYARSSKQVRVVIHYEAAQLVCMSQASLTEGST